MDFSRFQIGAHRGLRLRYPDNTAAGIVAGAAVADFVEIDVRATADGVLALSHDPMLGDRTIADSTWAELAGLDLGGGYPPATLDEALDVAGSTPLNIEIKHDPEEPGFDPSFGFPLEVAARARPSDLITSFHWPTMHAIRRRHPELSTGLLLDITGCLKDVLAEAPRRGHGTVAVHWSHVDDDAKLERVVASGLNVVVWTVNDLDAALRFRRAGVGAIITDDPERMVQAMRRDHEHQR